MSTFRPPTGPAEPQHSQTKTSRPGLFKQFFSAYRRYKSIAFPSRQTQVTLEQNNRVAIPFATFAS